MHDQIPTEADWSGRKPGVDSDWAYKHYLGLTVAAVEEKFIDSDLSVCEDLEYMPPIPFRYYVFAPINVLLSERGRGLSDGASCFLNLLLAKGKHERATLAPIRDQSINAVNHIAENQTFYDADLHIYGDFRARRDEFLRLLDRLAHSP